MIPRFPLAFEEKRKEQEEKEQQIREQILQQRKEKFEEVTEKFQRAHIPLSQRRRAVFQKRVPLLEEALKQIQESNLKSEVNLLPSYRPTINWRAINNALPSSLSKNDHKHQKHLLSKINCGKELKENNRANLATNKDAFQLKLEETQKLLEDQHLSSLQIFCDEVNQLTNSETLSSIDSLEAGEHEEIYLTLEELCTSSQKSSISPKSVNLQAANLSGGGEDELSFSKTQRINNWLVNVNDPKTETVPSVSDTLSKANVLPSCECLNGEDQSAPAERVTERADHSVASVYSRPASRRDGKCTKVSETSAGRAADSCSGTFKRERPFVTESPTFKFSRVGTAADRLTREPATFADRGGACALAAESAAASCVPVATRTALPCGGLAARPSPESSRRRPLGPAQCSDKLGGLPEVREDTLQDVPRDKADPPLFSAGVPVAWVPPRSASDSGTHARAQTSAWGCSVGPHRTGKHSAHERGGGVFLKSILKKESKCERGRFKALVVSHSGRCGGPRAALRDSAELAQEKATETAKTVKKLRWFDEPRDPAGQALKSRTEPCPQRGPSFRPQPRRGAAGRGAARPQEDGVSETAAAPGAPAAAPVPLTCFVPSGCDAAEQAWPTSGTGERPLPRPRGGSKAETARPRGAGARRRTRSAPAQGALSWALGRDAAPRPRSAGRAHGPWAAQGAPPVPPPPPRSTSCRSPWAFGCPATPHGDPQPVTAPGCLRASPVLPPERGGLSAWGREGGGPLAHMPSGPGPAMPSPRGSRRRTRAEAAGSGGSGARPARGDARRPPPLRAVREESVSRRKAPSDARGRREADAGSPVVRRKQIVEDKQRSLLEQKRENPASAGKKCGECTSNLEQSAQPSSSEPKHTTRCTSDVEEVSDSTSQFLMAENLVKASVPEDEILAVMNSRQLQKPHLAVNKTQPLNVCALPAAEQKLLQSLSHLNERFHYVQEAICKNPSIRNTLQIIPLLNSRPRGSLSPGVGSRLQRKY
ncbi:centrosomal protein of 126 kDa isoform X1 [Mustela erminea]|uniref:centrosomal protein of 126 kDa isoform X1 n=1 Tax=Mustela erminea TaxID=36723 RepID=UPI0013869803|nr:centrosomal protein of 126 kDa isoform X1 [Mustela erminea]